MNKNIIAGTKVVIYARYSSRNQHETSIEAQISECKKFAQINNLIVVDEYIDRAQTAKNSDREEFLRMIKDSKKNIFKVILIHKYDRFARNLFDQSHYEYKLERNGVKLFSVSEKIDTNSPEGIMMKNMIANVNEYYSNNLSREVMKGMKATAKNGGHNGGTPPLGYNLSNETRQKKYLINKAEAEIVNIIFSMYSNGSGYTEIADYLNSLGYKTKKGNSFNKNSFVDLLRNEKYIGNYIFNKRPTKDRFGHCNNHSRKLEDEIIKTIGVIPRIVSNEVWHKVQERIKTNKRTTGSFTARETYLLTGKIVCAECGHSFVGSRRTGGRNKHLYITYKCNNKSRDHKCSVKEINRDYLEKYVLSSITDLLFTDKMAEDTIDRLNKYLKEKQSDSNCDLENDKFRLKEIEKKIKNLTTAIEQGVLSNTIINNLNEAESTKAILIEKINNIASIQNKKLINVNEVKDLFKKLREETLDIIERNQKDELKSIINTFIDNIIISNNDIEIIFNYKNALIIKSDAQDVLDLINYDTLMKVSNQ